MPDANNSYQDCNVWSTERQTRFDVSREERQLPRDDNEAIVVGVVHSGAPWFLIGWAEGTEVKCMINTGCQVTIVATLVFKRMCVSDSRIRAQLRPCGRRLISADSSPLIDLWTGAAWLLPPV